MKIFVTGGTGFIGTRLVRELSETGHDLHCLAREGSDVRVLQEVGGRVVPGDLTERDSLLRGMDGCEWVVNVANLFEFWVRDRRLYEAVNVEGTRNVMEVAIEVGASKVVHISTVGVYGNAEWPVTEGSPFGPECASRYALSKRMGDGVCWELFESGRLPLVTIHPGGVLGPDDPKAAGRYVRNVVLGRMPAQVLTRRVFPWVYVGDVAKVTVRALTKPDNVGEKYIVVAENRTFGEINEMLSEISGRRLPRLVLPEWATVLGAYMATGLAHLTRRPPLLDMSVDQVRLMKQGMEADGSKVTRELGITYTPIRVALEEAVEGLIGAGVSS